MLTSDVGESSWPSSIPAICSVYGDPVGSKTGFVGRPSFLSGFQNAREVLFLPDVFLTVG